MLRFPLCHVIFASCLLMIAWSPLAQASEAPRVSPASSLKWQRVYAWEEGRIGPKGREHAAMWTDQSGRLHVYGGYAFIPEWLSPNFEHWVMDPATESWTLLGDHHYPTSYYEQDPKSGAYIKIEGTLAGSSGMRFARIPGEDSLLIMREVGHSYSLTHQAYTFKVDNDPLVKLNFGALDTAVWEKVLSSAPAISLAGFSYDPPNEQYLSYCGIHAQDGNKASCKKVYAFRFTDAARTTGGWKLLTPEGDEEPAARYGFPSIYDQVNQRLVLFGGGSQTCTDNAVCPLNDVWTLSTTKDSYRWQRLDIPSPEGGRNNCWAYDPLKNRMYVLGGTLDAKTSVADLHILDLTLGKESWSRVALPEDFKTRSSCSATYDANKRRIYFGFGNSPQPFEDIWALELDAVVEP